MNRPTAAALAPLLRTNAENCIRRARAIGQGLTVPCRRCSGSGNYGFAQRCYDCGGNRVLLAVDALAVAEALIASGELDAYLARTEEKRAAAEAAKRAEREYEAKHAEEMAASYRRCEALMARYSAARSAFARDCDDARALGLNDAIARANEVANYVAGFTAPSVVREPRLERAVWGMETLAAEFAAFVADARTPVAAPAWDTREETYRAALARRAEMDAADAAAAIFARIAREAQASEMVVAI